jgi:hypothetical protein
MVASSEVERTDAGDSGIAIVALAGELDLTNGHALAERLREVSRESRLVLDLSNLVFIDSAGLHHSSGSPRSASGARWRSSSTRPPPSPARSRSSSSTGRPPWCPRSTPHEPSSRARRPPENVSHAPLRGISVPHYRKEQWMGISLSIFLIAVGAILAWAVDAEVSGIDLQVAGIILVIVGALGFVASLIFWSSWGGFGGTRDAGGQGGQNTTVVDR